jgi:hypothetical protein
MIAPIARPNLPTLIPKITLITLINLITPNDAELLSFEITSYNPGGKQTITTTTTKITTTTTTTRTTQQQHQHQPNNLTISSHFMLQSHR